MSKVLTDNIVDYMDYYNNFKTLKTRNKQDFLLNEIKRTFLLVKSPYMFLLHCFSYNKEIYDLKPKSLCFLIIEGFKQYTKENANQLPDISIELQNEGYLIAKEAKYAVTKSILKIFRCEMRKDIFLPLIKDELKHGNYNFVCTASMCMNLQDEFTSFELTIPLYFLNLSNHLKDFLSSNENQCKCFLQTLDKFVAEEYNFLDIQQLVPNNANMKTKSISEAMKYALTVIKDYKLDLEVCPKIAYSHTCKTIYYLFKKYFSLNEMSKFSFCLFLTEFVNKIPTLENDIQNLFIQYDDKEVSDIFHKMKRNKPDLSLQESCYENRSDHHYYQLSIDKRYIYFIDNIENFEQSISKIMCYSVVGIDCEWQPITFIGSKEELALIQVAVEDAVYVFDLYVLSKIFLTEHWEQLGNIFSSSIMKLTYGFKNDSKILSNINKTFGFHMKMIQNNIDFDNIKEGLLLFNPSLFSFSTGTSLRGLSELVYLCYGLPLNKLYQYSYWKHRPLGRREIQYAATDAHCLIQIKNYLDGISSELGIEDWTKLKSHQITADKKSTKAYPYNSQPISVHQIKFVCDTMVQGLGRLLRHCGIDAKVLLQSDHHDKCVSIYEKEGRVVLTRGSVYNRLTKFIPENYVHLLREDTAQLQLEEVVSVFNIKITEKDVFGRCADCNSSNYLTASQEIMYKMKTHSHANDQEPDEWTDVNGGKVNCRRKITHRMVPIKVDDIPLGVLDNLSILCICGGCGKCYWDGSHYEKVLKNMLKSLVL